MFLSQTLNSGLEALGFCFDDCRCVEWREAVPAGPVTRGHVNVQQGVAGWACWPFSFGGNRDWGWGVPEFPSWKWILLPFPRTSIPKVSCVKLTKHFLNTALVNSTQPQSVSR